MAMTPAQIASAKAQIAAAKAAALQAVLTDLQSSTCTIGQLLTDIATAKATLDSTDQPLQVINAMSSLLTPAGSNLIPAIGQLQAVAASAPPAGS